MADYILVRKTRNAASSAVHILLNVLFGIGSVMITALTGSLRTEVYPDAELGIAKPFGRARIVLFY